MRASYHRYFQHEVDPETRPGHRSPFQALQDRRDEDQAFDLLGMPERQGRGNAPFAREAERKRERVEVRRPSATDQLLDPRMALPNQPVQKSLPSRLEQAGA